MKELHRRPYPHPVFCPRDNIPLGPGRRNGPGRGGQGEIEIPPAAGYSFAHKSKLGCPAYGSSPNPTPRMERSNNVIGCISGKD
jgi:hypothetical protein